LMDEDCVPSQKRRGEKEDCAVSQKIRGKNHGRQQDDEVIDKSVVLNEVIPHCVCVNVSACKGICIWVCAGVLCVCNVSGDKMEKNAFV